MTLGDKIRSLDDDKLTNFILKMMVRSAKLALKCSGYGPKTQKTWTQKSLIERRDVIYNHMINEIPSDFDDTLVE